MQWRISVQSNKYTFKFGWFRHIKGRVLAALADGTVAVLPTDQKVSQSNPFAFPSIEGYFGYTGITNNVLYMILLNTHCLHMYVWAL